MFVTLSGKNYFVKTLISDFNPDSSEVKQRTDQLD